MGDFLSWLEASTLGRVIRESGVWTYALLNLAHILGVSTLFGSVLVLDLRLLGVWRRTSLHTLATAADPLARTGFVVAAASGLCLLATNGTEYIGNPFLLIKFPAIGLGLANVAVLRRTDAWQRRRAQDPSGREARQLAWLGGLSLACWLTAITAGRLIAYW